LEEDLLERFGGNGVGLRLRGSFGGHG
jgi:hypothetical protein